jgi:hypothetical protein
MITVFRADLSGISFFGSIEIKDSCFSTKRSVSVKVEHFKLFACYSHLSKSLFVSEKCVIWFHASSRNRLRSESMAVLVLYGRWSCDGCMILLSSIIKNVVFIPRLLLSFYI